MLDTHPRTYEYHWDPTFGPPPIQSLGLRLCVCSPRDAGKLTANDETRGGRRAAAPPAPPLVVSTLPMTTGVTLP